MKYQCLLLVSLIVFISSCATIESDWKKAESSNTIVAYEDFLKHHSYSKSANEARSRVEKLQFEEAVKQDQILLYNTFLKKYPNSKNYREVKHLLENKKSLLKNSNIKKIRIEQEGKQNIDLLVETAIKDIIVVMGFEVVPLNSSDFDAKLRIGETHLEAAGSFAMAGSPFIIFNYVAKVNLYHKQYGTVFEDEIYRELNQLVKLVEENGRLVPSSELNPEVKKKALDELPKMVQVYIPKLFEEWLGQGFELLINNLRSEDVLLRDRSVTALANLGDRRAIEPLIAVLKDKDEKVRKSAVGALEKITGQKFGDNSTQWKEWWDNNKAK
jgi:hypothetical protein